jgi:5'-methylthioadenosine phosphorylase
MTAIPEAKLAREAELSYGLLATATDYDCWHATEEDVSVEAV